MPVFLIYAGIIHAIGLALLLPIMITLPGPVSETAPETLVIDIEVIPANSAAAIIGHDDEETAALPSVAGAPGDGAESGADAVANVAPEAQTEHEQEAVQPPEDSAQAEVEKPSKTAAHAAAKKSATRSRTAKPSAHRAKTNTQIAPFNGALSGLFAPGAPANKRR